MVNFQFFVYDSSIAAPLSRVPVWPYSLTYQMPHKCHGNAQNCPSRYCLPTCTVFRHTYSLTYHMPHKCHGNAQNCPSRYCLPTCTLYSILPPLSPTRCHTSVTEIPQQVLLTYLYSVQTYLLPHLSYIANSVTAMHRIAPAGTAYLHVHCTLYYLFSHLPDAAQVSSLQRAELPQQVLHIYLYSVHVPETSAPNCTSRYGYLQKIYTVYCTYLLPTHGTANLYE